MFSCRLPRAQWSLPNGCTTSPPSCSARDDALLSRVRSGRGTRQTASTRHSRHAYRSPRRTRARTACSGIPAAATEPRGLDCTSHLARRRRRIDLETTSACCLSFGVPFDIAIVNVSAEAPFYSLFSIPWVPRSRLFQRSQGLPWATPSGGTTTNGNTLQPTKVTSGRSWEVMTLPSAAVENSRPRRVEIQAGGIGRLID